MLTSEQMYQVHEYLEGAVTATRRQLHQQIEVDYAGRSRWLAALDALRTLETMLYASTQRSSD